MEKRCSTHRSSTWLNLICCRVDIEVRTGQRHYGRPSPSSWVKIICSLLTCLGSTLRNQLVLINSRSFVLRSAYCEHNRTCPCSFVCLCDFSCITTQTHPSADFRISGYLFILLCIRIFAEQCCWTLMYTLNRLGFEVNGVHGSVQGCDL